MKKQALAFITTMALITTASTTWATQYTYTFSGADLMNYSTAYAPDGKTPADIFMYDGARRFTPDTGSASSSWLSSSRADFVTMATTSGYALGMFNLWGFGGFGGADAAAWGETFSVGSWTDSGTATMGWASGLFSDPDTLGKTVLGFGRTAAGNALSFNALTWPTFTFTLDLPDSTPWLSGKAGELVFWFGGYMVENATDVDAAIVGRLQGNMVLDPVPEPATMLLFGAGLAGLVAVGRRKKVN